MLFTWNGAKELFVNLTVPGIEAAIAGHLVMLFRDVLDEAFDELHDGNGLLHVLVILVAVVVEGDGVAVILVNPRGGDDGTAKVTADVLDDRFRVTLVGLGIHVEAVLVFPVAAGFHLLERRADFGLHFIEQGGAGGISKVGVVEVPDVAPEPVVTVTAFRDEAVDVRVPLQVSAEGTLFFSRQISSALRIL